MRTTGKNASVWIAVASAAIVGGLSAHAHAIGICEQTTHESKLLGASQTLGYVAILRTDQTCTEGPDGGPVEKTTRTIRIVNGRGKIVRTFAVTSASQRPAYLRKHKFKALGASDSSPNALCDIIGNDESSKLMRVVLAKRTLFKKKMRPSGDQLAIESYWFAKAKLLVLHVKRTSNPGHYAQHSTSSMLVLPAHTHGLKHCY